MILDRLKEYIDYKGISIAAFERSIGMANASFGKSLKNKGAIGTDKLENILRTYPDINVDWLMRGEGDMIASSAPIIQRVPEGSHEGIPLIPVSAMAGVMKGEVTIMEYECERYMVPAFKGADFLMRVQGESMQPTYRSGDLVACQRVPLIDIFFQWGKAYVIDTDQGPFIKRLRPGHDEEHVLIVSDNSEDFPSFELHRSRLNGVALIRGLIRLE